MIDDPYQIHFLSAANDWICDSYSIDIRYFAGKNAFQIKLWEALIVLSPLPSAKDINFQIETDQFYAGQCQLNKQPKQLLKNILENAIQGKVEVYGNFFCLNDEQPYNFYTEMIHQDRWFSDLHLQVTGSKLPAQTAIDTASIDNALRQNKLPFDGLADISGWLGLRDPRVNHNPPTINIRVLPPVDIIIAESKLDDNKLHLKLNAHPHFDVSRVNLGIRMIPGNALEARKQVGSSIKWKKVRNGKREGVVLIRLDQADSVLVMLMVGASTVRRQWFSDPTRARNLRLVAVQNFDKDLRMIKQAVLEVTSIANSDRFEKGIAALLFLQGFTPALQVETDSPDIVVTTPNGKLIVVECTTRIADFGSKLGKLVDRKGSLSKALQASSHHSRVEAVLVCALPRDQIVIDSEELKKHQVILITKDDLNGAFDALRFPSDPDEMLEKAVNQLTLGVNVFK